MAAPAALASIEAICPAFAPVLFPVFIVELESFVIGTEWKELIWGFKY